MQSARKIVQSKSLWAFGSVREMPKGNVSKTRQEPSVGRRTVETEEDTRKSENSDWSVDARSYHQPREGVPKGFAKKVSFILLV